MKTREVILFIEKEKYEAITKQLEEQARLLSASGRTTTREYIQEVLLPLGFAAAEQQIMRARAPHIITP